MLRRFLPFTLLAACGCRAPELDDHTARQASAAEARRRLHGETLSVTTARRASVPTPIHRDHDRYVVRRRDSTTFFTSDGLAFSLLGPDHRGFGLRASLAHAGSPHAGGRAPTPDGALPGRSSSFVGPRAEWAVAEPTYQRVLWSELRPGVDMIAEPVDAGIAYRFVVSPGADLADLTMTWEGARAVRAVDGGVDVETEIGALRIRDLHAFTSIANQRTELPARLVVRGDEVSIAVEGWSGDVPLIVDPTIAWGSFVGGSAGEVGRGVGVDAAGNVLVAGSVNSTDFPVLGAFDATLATGPDAFVTKVSPTGALVWSSYLGGNGADIPWDLAVDADGDVLITGETASTDFRTDGGFDATHGGMKDAFVTKVTAGGALAWSTYLGGTGDDLGHAITTDAERNVLVAGIAGSAGLATIGDTSLSGSSDGFVFKMTPAGVVTWATYLGGAATDRVQGIAADAAGNVLVTGVTTSTDFPSTGGFDTALSNTDAFVTKLSPAGAIAWSSYLGGSGVDLGYAIAVDGAGDVYVAGQTHSADFPTTGGFDTTYGAQDAFVTKITSAGTIAWSTYLGGGAGDVAEDLAVDAASRVIVVGNTTSLDFPTSGGFDTTPNGSDAFVTKLSGSGGLLWSSYLGGSGADYGHRIALDAKGDALIAGYTSSSLSFPVGGGGFDLTSTDQDAFVVKLGFASNGATCTVTAECLSGFCADSVCCDVACVGACLACSASRKGSGVDGACAPITAGTDPKDACAAGTDPCGADGFCDGAGSCRSFAKPNTPCGPATCTNASQSGKVCKGDSLACVDSTGIACAPYACGASACKTSCTADTDCDASAFCSGGACVPKSANGATCTEGRVCVSGLCTDSVCCNSACTGQCESCAEPGTVGTCTAVTGKPRSARPACDALAADDCGRTTCDGSIREKCAGFENGATTICGAQACTADKRFQPAGNCDGRGKCSIPAAVPCTPFACELSSSTGCKVQCAGPADCADGFACTEGACVQGATCNADRSASVDKTGKEQPCTPYRCGTDGSCQQQCTGTDECIGGTICDPPTRSCIAAPSGGEDSGGCTHHGRGDGAGAATLTLLAAIAARARRTSTRA